MANDGTLGGGHVPREIPMGGPCQSGRFGQPEWNLDMNGFGFGGALDASHHLEFQP